MSRTVEVTELALRDGHQSLLATRMATRRHGSGLRGHRSGGLLERRMLGGGDLRFLHPLPQRGPVGAAPHVPQAHAELPPADAPSRAEPARLPALRGHRRRPIRGQVGRERHGRLPRLRRAQRRPEPPPRPRGGPADRQALRGDHLLHHLARCTPSRSSSRWPSSSRTSAADSICIKDMAALLRPQPAYDLVRGIKEACGQDTLVHVHVHSTTGVTLVSLMKAIEAGADIVDTSISSLSLGPGHNPTEALVEMLAGDRLHHPAEEGPAPQDQGALRQDPPPVRRVRVQDHRRRDRDLRQPDPRRHDLEHGEPAQAARGRRPAQGGAGRGPQRPQGRRLPAAGHAVQPDRRHAGRVQRPDGPLQGADRRVRRPDARLLRREHRPARPGGHRGRRQARQEGPDHLPAGRPAQARMGGTPVSSPRR